MAAGAFSAYRRGQRGEQEEEVPQGVGCRNQWQRHPPTRAYGGIRAGVVIMQIIF